MTDIGQIDKRLAVSTSFGRDDIVMHDPRQEPFTLYGVYYDYEKGVYRRMAEEIASTVNDGVKELSIHTAGGRVCFSTDADAIAISCRRPTGWPPPPAPHARPAAAECRADGWPAGSDRKSVV